MWSWPNHLRTTLAFLPSTSVLSFERRVWYLVNSARSLSSSRATRWLMYSLPFVGVEAEDGEREGQQQALEQRQPEALGDAGRGADELVLGDLVDQVDQVQSP